MDKSLYSFKRNVTLTTLRIFVCFFLLHVSKAADFIPNYDFTSTTTLDPSTTGFTIIGSSYSEIGSTLGTAGDINQDGYDDILVGSSMNGRAYVIYGGPTSSLSNLDLSILLNPATTGFTISLTPYSSFVLSSAGDINKDGYNDILIGAPGALTGYGAAYVIYGRPKSLLSNLNLNTQILDPATTGFTVRGAAYPDFVGIATTRAGDINKDGYDDILISSSISYGTVFVIYGGPTSSFSDINVGSQTLDPATTGFTIRGTTSSTLGRLGSIVEPVGDMNKDGYDDFLFTFPQKKTTYIMFGGEKSSFSHLALSETTPDPPFAGFKISNFDGPISGAGDVDGDGYDDIILGVPTKNNNQGVAYVIYGGPTSSLLDFDLNLKIFDPATTGFTISGNSTISSFGSEVKAAGDLNNDGYDDIFVRSGARATTYAFYGQARSSISNIDLSSAPPDPATTGFMIRNAESIARIGGDVNGDGISDILIASPQKLNSKGVVYLIHSSRFFTY